MEHTVLSMLVASVFISVALFLNPSVGKTRRMAVGKKKNRLVILDEVGNSYGREGARKGREMRHGDGIG